MNFFITFLEGLISFVSPCMLPMLPIYVSYFAGSNENGEKKNHSFLNALAFVFGFTLIFCLLGIFAGTIGMLLFRYKQVINIVSGIIVILFGLSYLGVFELKFLKGVQKNIKISGVFTSFLFGIIFSVSMTPCVGTFLGSALMLASSEGTAAKGILLLLTYSLGLGIPFLISTILLEKLKTTFDFIKRHYKTINIVCGSFLIIVGIFMATGRLSWLMSLLGR